MSRHLNNLMATEIEESRMVSMQGLLGQILAGYELYGECEKA